MAKSVVLELLQNQFHVKSEKQENPEISALCDMVAGGVKTRKRYRFHGKILIGFFQI